MIRKANIEDLPKLSELANIFTELSEFVGVDMNVFCKNWARFIKSGFGVIFICEKDNIITGMIGGLKFNDPNTDILIASELFWIVHPDHRGGGMDLLKSFENWAKYNGCKKIIMIHMADSMPDTVKKIYELKGYKEMETHYIKGV